MPFRLLLFICCCLFQVGYGQANPFMKDVNGRPLYLKVTYVSEGSPYLEDAYRPADITTTAHKTYTGIMTKVNLMENYVQFLAPDGSEMVATMPVKKIKFHATAKEGAASNMVLEGFTAPINEPGARIYAVLDSGKVLLLKHLKTAFRDDRRYNEATVTRVFTQNPVYYALADNREIKIEKNREFLLQLFHDKAKEVLQFIVQNNLKCKTEEDLLRVFQYYNSLF